MPSPALLTGSPPPAWGKHRPRHIPQRGSGRFTPTRVGKANPSPRWPAAGTAAGSPPPAWGKRIAAGTTKTIDRFTPTRVGKALDVGPQRDCVGFTPTRVGKAPPGPRPARSAWVHPHPRGESPYSAKPVLSIDSGSPPPAWGKRPLSAQRTKVGMRVHPHPRGESPTIRPRRFVSGAM